ncbi:hypothetical protein RGQ13_18585 [Thalassotalea psychrophila]|uniref:Uncharacterized protein n=1 Tax=Thalassotalea psychrophila TaxID=3065647 RepID=A0ABY9TUU3_9GAMM|nr:hypothetical protein RGQ13_18585 [Colwelliaceae bacterium SQ149]
MNVDKAKKLIAKQVKKGFKGYPQISLEYFGESADCATEVAIQFTLEEGSDVQEERFSSESDVRENEVIQSALIKIIQRANANSVIEVAGVSNL